MPRIFKQDLLVGEEAADTFGHVNNQKYIAWMQDVAIRHSAAQGWPMERYLELGAAWVVRSHFIEYLHPAFPGDRLELFTWTGRLELRNSLRGYLFRRGHDHRVLAQAQTVWVYVDLKSGKPLRVPDALKSAFDAVPPNDPELRALGARAGDRDGKT